MANESTPLLPQTTQDAAKTAVEGPVTPEQLVETSASSSPAHVTAEQSDAALPDNKARALLLHDLATSRVRLQNWQQRLKSKKLALQRLVYMQLVSSIVATLFATLAAIIAVIGASGETKPTHSALNSGAVIAICNALFGAVASITSSVVAQIRRGQEDEKEPETSQARVTELMAWRQEATNYVYRFKDRWLSSLDEDVDVLSKKLPADVI